MISLGTGDSPTTASNNMDNQNNYQSKSDDISLYFEFAYLIETSSENKILEQLLGENFSRLQTYTEASGMSHTEYWFNKMKAEGKEMWNNPIDEDKQEVRNLLMKIID